MRFFLKYFPLIVLSVACAWTGTARTCAGAGDNGVSDKLCWQVSMNGVGASRHSLPFWAVANKRGIVPNASGGFMTAGIWYDRGFQSSNWHLHLGLKMSASAIGESCAKVYAAPMIHGRPGFGAVEKSILPARLPVTRSVGSLVTHMIPQLANVSWDGMVTRHQRGLIWNGVLNEFYFGLGWKALRWDVGMIDRKGDYEGLSLSDGNVVWSGNARSLPGCCLSLDWVEVPGTRGIWSLRAHWGDYQTMDSRYVRRALLHNKSFDFRFRLHPRVYFTIGLEHFSLWAGTSPLYGPQPDKFSDYVKVVLGKSGDKEATASDQINVLGDHRGREIVRVDWYADRFRLTFAHDIPFDDGSGMGLQNFPDGVNTIHLSFNDRKRWVSDILYELVYTKCQSGPAHDRPATPEELEQHPDRPFIVQGGADNYFNNGEYRSGWTYFGKTIGLPLFTPAPIDSDGMILGVVNNRVIAHHVGLEGCFLRSCPYRFKATYSRNYGKYYQSVDLFDSIPWQLSLGLEVTTPTLFRRFPIRISLGFYGDVGELYVNNFGMTLCLSYGGSFRK